MSGMAKMLMTLGGVIFVAGAVLWLAGRFDLPLGRLPGDLTYHGKNVRVYAPFATMIVVSVILTVIMNIISRIGK